MDTLKIITESVFTSQSMQYFKIFLLGNCKNNVSEAYTNLLYNLSLKPHTSGYHRYRTTCDHSLGVTVPVAHWLRSPLAMAKDAWIQTC